MARKNRTREPGIDMRESVLETISRDCSILTTKFVAFGVAASLLVTACGTTRSSVSKNQRHLAADKTDELRELFNKNVREDIYTQATAHFRSQLLRDWEARCDDLQKELGSWNSFATESAWICGSEPSPICLDGTAIFGQGHRSMKVAWMLEDGQLRLLFLALGRDGKSLEVIPPGPQRFFDTPPPPGSKWPISHAG
jgi:hypothetical protein